MNQIWAQTWGIQNLKLCIGPAFADTENAVTGIDNTARIQSQIGQEGINHLYIIKLGIAVIGNGDGVGDDITDLINVVLVNVQDKATAKTESTNDTPSSLTPFSAASACLDTNFAEPRSRTDKEAQDNKKKNTSLIAKVAKKRAAAAGKVDGSITSVLKIKEETPLISVLEEDDERRDSDPPWLCQALHCGDL